MIRKIMNWLTMRYYRHLSNEYFERMTHHDTMQSFNIRDDVGGVGVISFVNKDHLKDLIDTMQKRYEEW